MQIVPDSASIQFLDNSTSAGTLVTYSTGVRSFFASGTCPQPVHKSLYEAVSAIQFDPRFVSAENGSRYVVDPTTSLTQPLTAPNGSSYEAVFFLDLNTSDTIYPCNLAGMYKNPLGQIEIVMPLLPDGTLNTTYRAIFATPGNELRFNCPYETGVSTFAISQIPSQFQVGGFSFHLLFNGTNYKASNGTSYSGFDYVFSVNFQNASQTVLFSWSSANAVQSNQEPSPFIATPFGEVVMRWFAANSTLYLRITTGA